MCLHLSSIYCNYGLTLDLRLPNNFQFPIFNDDFQAALKTDLSTQKPVECRLREPLTRYIN